MGTSQMLGEDIDSWETMMFLYNSALKEVGTKLEILNDEFVHIHKYNPIEYIKSRIKTPESIVKKLKRDGYESTIENMRNYINDIAAGAIYNCKRSAGFKGVSAGQPPGDGKPEDSGGGNRVVIWRLFLWLIVIFAKGISTTKAG